MEFVLNRNYNFRSTSGHMLNFKKGQPVYVPPVCHREVIAIGAEPVEGKVDVLGEEQKEIVPLTPQERAEHMFRAFAEMERRDVRGDFNAQGLPNLKVLESLTGIGDITSTERSEAWQQYREAKTD